MSEEISRAQESRLSRAEENKRKREYWSSHIERWQESGLSQRVYCREHNLKDHQFVYWKKRIIRTGTESKFVSLNLGPFKDKQPLQHAVRPLQLILHNGFTIEIHPGFDPHLLRQLIIVLRGLQ